MSDGLETTAHPKTPQRLFTIGIPVFNNKLLLRNCLESVLASNLPRARFEIVIADDGSTEPETLAILAEYERELAADPGFFRVISLGRNSGGAARPRNRILDAATGEYVFFVDSDDTIGELALQRIAEALAKVPADWVAVHQVPVNGRGALATITQAHAEVRREKALRTLTVHKVFRRAEIERQRLRFDEKLPSGQDVSFAFSFILHASRFLMLGGYDYYFLTQHLDDPNEPAHLSRSAKAPEARITKNERILGSMLTALERCDLPDVEKQWIVANVVLPRLLIRMAYLRMIVRAGRRTGSKALQRLSNLLDNPLVTELDPATIHEVTSEQLAVITAADWDGLARLEPVDPDVVVSPVARLKTKGRHLVDVATGRARHRRLLNQLRQLRRSLDEVREAQLRLESELREHLTRDQSTTSKE